MADPATLLDQQPIGQVELQAQAPPPQQAGAMRKANGDAAPVAQVPAPRQDEPAILQPVDQRPQAPAAADEPGCFSRISTSVANCVRYVFDSIYACFATIGRAIVCPFAYVWSLISGNSAQAPADIEVLRQAAQTARAAANAAQDNAQLQQAAVEAEGKLAQAEQAAQQGQQAPAAAPPQQQQQQQQQPPVAARAPAEARPVDTVEAEARAILTTNLTTLLRQAPRQATVDYMTTVGYAFAEVLDQPQIKLGGQQNEVLYVGVPKTLRATAEGVVQSETVTNHTDSEVQFLRAVEQREMVFFLFGRPQAVI